MEHSMFVGSHREIGLRWGAELRERGHRLLDHVPYPLGEGQLAFGRACRPIYERYFPALLEEVDGLAAGQGCDREALEGLLFSMYALVPQSHCSCFAVANPKGVFLARNSDFWLALKPNNRNVRYHFTDGGYAFTGNTTAFVEMEDGVNEKGLAVGMTAVAGTKARPGLNAGMLVRLCLETCTTVAQALTALGEVPVASAQTLILADRTGEVALAELAPQSMAVARPGEEGPFVRAVNRFSLPGMAPFQQRGVDDWRSAERWETLTGALTAGAGELTAANARALLAGKKGYLCQRDPAAGRGTVWSVVYDLTGEAIHRAEGCPDRVPFQREGWPIR